MTLVKCIVILSICLVNNSEFIMEKYQVKETKFRDNRKYTIDTIVADYIYIFSIKSLVNINMTV